MMQWYKRIEHNVVDVGIVHIIVQKRNHFLRILLIKIIKLSNLAHKKIISYSLVKDNKISCGMYVFLTPESVFARKNSTVSPLLTPSMSNGIVRSITS